MFSDLGLHISMIIAIEINHNAIGVQVTDNGYLNEFRVLILCICRKEQKGKEDKAEYDFHS